VLRGIEFGGYSGLIVVFKKVSHARAVGVWRPKVPDKSIRLMMYESVVEHFIVGIVESVRLELRLVVPVHLSEEEKIRMVPTNLRDRFGPP
jgi:hypothetical protein